ncbi:MAG TPA: 23S rRNA (uracil(1939)-C(5))-methyltransferase RlmD, partial [Candidatus Omnitrophota bacterium]|nr:23S rRNA (uracil(1939)-C(5))-methyltransferase RlmD [Candidatus Omnitrophota bacterium]
MAIKIEIKDVDEKGKGIGGDLFIPLAYPGDVIEAEMTSKKKKTGRMLSLVTPSLLRQPASCKHFGECGGCLWQGMKYESQLALKESRVRSLFGEVSRIIPSPEIFFYRNRMDFAFGPGFTLGLKNGKATVVDIEKCWLMSDASNTILLRIKKFVSERNLESYWTGIMRHAVVREGKNINNIVLNILTSDKGTFPVDDLYAELKDAISGVTWSINLSPADRSVGDIQKSCGADHLMESLNGIKFRVPVQSFFQTNTRQAERLLTTVGDLLEKEEVGSILDLYSGTGSFGLYLAGRAKKVIGVEENADAVELSRSNAELNGIGNYSAVAGRVEDVIGNLSHDYDTVIMDPPRPGVNKKILKKLGEVRPRTIVYVSCNPSTQEHDIGILKEYGYKIVSCQPLDMFPHTPHIENVALLKY